MIKFKKNFDKIFLFNKILLFFLFIILSYNGLNYYIGNKGIYLLFCSVSIFLFFFSIRKKFFFFELFFGLLLFLGFWFKLVITISFNNGVFKEGFGLFDNSPKSFDNVLLISTCGITAFILSGFFRQKFFNYPNFSKTITDPNQTYIKNRGKIIIFFILLIFSVFFTNVFFKVYQRGLLSQYDLNFVLSGIIKWFLLFGLSSFSSLIIYLELRLKKKINGTLFFLSIFETFLSAISMLSRGMIFNASAIFFGAYINERYYQFKFNLLFYVKYLLVIVFFFYLSVISVNYIRAKFFYIGQSYLYTNDDVNLNNESKGSSITNLNKINKKFDLSLEKSNYEFIYLLVNRWVGVDAVMALEGKKRILNFNFLIEAIKEKPYIDKPTFYEENFGLRSFVSSSDAQLKIKGNTLTGIIAFLYYSGSFIFLFFGIFFIVLAANFIEYISFKFSYQNFIFSSLIGQVIAFRFIHFGYLPSQSYLLFGTIFLNIILIYFFTRIFSK